MGFFGKKKKEVKTAFHVIKDDYKTYDEIHAALRESGVESCNLIVGVDYTRSNVDSGLKSFDGKSLHSMDNVEKPNPYQRSLTAVGRVLEKFDDDNMIPAFGFGDSFTRDKDVFSFFPDGRACHGLQEVLDTYARITPKVQLSGPTSFEPLIRKTIEIAKKEGGYYVLLIICDGQVSDPELNRKAIVEASNYPISIVCVGVGDGPFEELSVMDDGLTQRKFDNFQFVPFEDIVHHPKNTNFAKVNDVSMRIALCALQEIPDQYAQIKKLGYLKGR